MYQTVQESIEVWKVADLKATDAESLVRLNVIKYAEGLCRQPGPAEVRRSVALRKFAQHSLTTCLHLLSEDGGLRHYKGRARFAAAAH